MLCEPLTLFWQGCAQAACLLRGGMWGKAMMGRRSNFFPLAAIIAVAMVGTPASAETLMEALALAYKDNPSITAARADQRRRKVDQDRRDGLAVGRERGIAV